MYEKMNEQIASYGVVPVVVLNDTKDALPLAKALVEGGLAVAEVTFAPHWSISFSDMYNHGSTGNHYYQGGVAYSLSGLNVSLNFGRTREGYVCSGGVCRWQPAYKGANLRIQWAF